VPKRKPIITLQVEGETPVTDPTPEKVRDALARMTPNGGPGFIILEGRGEDYAQVAGGDGLFTAEWREYLSEDFKHWKAGLREVPSKGEAVIPTNGAQIIKVQNNERLNSVEAATILLAYLSGERRPAQFVWRDMSEMFRE